MPTPVPRARHLTRPALVAILTAPGNDCGGAARVCISSGFDSGPKLVSGLVAPEGGTANLVIDWNLPESVHAPDGRASSGYLRPALRVSYRTDWLPGRRYS